MESKSSSIRINVLWNASSKYLGKFIQFLTVIYVARHLTPLEVGLFAIAGSFFALINQIKSWGVNNYIYKKDCTDIGVREAYGTCNIINCILILLIIVSANSFSKSFKIPELQLVILILSTSLFFSPYVIIKHALLSKNMQFKTQSYITLGASVTQSFVTILLIEFQYSYYSLALSIVASQLFQATTLLSIKGYKVKPKYSNVFNHVKYGLTITLNNVNNRIYYLLPDIILGKTTSLHNVAIFSRALGLLDFASTLIQDGIKPVINSYLSDSSKRINEMHDIYEKSTRLSCSLILPCIAFIFYQSEIIVEFLFGSAWNESSYIIDILCFWVVLKSLNLNFNSVMTVFGKEKLLLYFTSVASLTLLVLMYYFSKYGLKFFSYSYVLVSLIEFTTSIFILSYTTSWNIIKLARSSAINLMIFLYYITVGYLLNVVLQDIKFDILNYFLFYSFLFFCNFVAFNYFSKSLLWLQLNKVLLELKN